MLSIWAGLKLCCLLKLKGLKPLLIYIDNYMYLEIIFLGCLQICPLQEVFVSYGVLFFSYDSAHSAYQPCLQDKKRKIVIFQIVKVTVAAKTKENKYLMHFELLRAALSLAISRPLYFFLFGFNGFVKCFTFILKTLSPLENRSTDTFNPFPYKL